LSWSEEELYLEMVSGVPGIKLLSGVSATPEDGDAIEMVMLIELAAWE